MDNSPAVAQQPEQYKINTIILFSNSGSDALTVLRFLGPAQQLGWKVISGIEGGQANIEAIREADVVILHREFCRDVKTYEQVTSLAHSLKIPVIFDLDDLLFELPEYHPDRISGFFANALVPMLQAVIEADLVTVSTRSLRDYLLPFNQNIEVIPNYLDDSLWQMKQPSQTVAENGAITIGYMGGHSHQPDLQMVLPALLEIHEKFPQKIRFHFWGINTPPELAPFSDLDWCPPKSFEYSEFAKYFQTQSADIMIAPLCENIFNSCKSSIKYLEYSAIGVPGVYSNVNPYSEIITDGIDGLLAKNSSEWVNQLSRLIENQELRVKIVVNAQKKINEKWLLSGNCSRQSDIYNSVRSNPDYFADRDHPFNKMLILLAQQNYEENQLVQQQIQSLKNDLEKTLAVNQSLEKNVEKDKDSLHSLQSMLETTNGKYLSFLNRGDENNQIIHSLQNQVNNLNNEVLSYAMSKSWKITRPLRKIFQWVKGKKNV
jgi:glycosyltransferase involved in cell wall biosynthesis